MVDKCGVNIVCEDYGIHACFLEHLYILSLLCLVLYIEYGVLMLLLVLLKALRKCEILAVKVLKENIILHFLEELVVLDAAVLDERIYVIPVLLVALLLGLAHSA